MTLFGRFDYANTQAAVPAGFVANRRSSATSTPSASSTGRSRRSRLKADYRRHEFGAGPSYNELAAALTWMF